MLDLLIFPLTCLMLHLLVESSLLYCCVYSHIPEILYIDTKSGQRCLIVRCRFLATSCVWGKIYRLFLIVSAHLTMLVRTTTKASMSVCPSQCGPRLHGSRYQILFTP